jgi:hypothetical protein
MNFVTKVWNYLPDTTHKWLLRCFYALTTFLLVWLIPIALFDHYFWSVWAGQSLLILALYIVLDAKDETRHSMGMR